MARLIFLNRYYYPDESATSQILTDLTFYLSALGYDVSVIAGRQMIDNPEANLPRIENAQGVLIYRSWSSKWGRKHNIGRAMDSIAFFAGLAYRLMFLVKKGDIIIAKTDPPLIGLVGMIAGRIKGARLVNWWQDIFPEAAERLGVRGLSTISGPLRWLRNLTCRTATINVVIGRCMQEILESASGSQAGSMTVIPNWADDVAIQPLPAADNPLRKKWGLDKSFVVGYSGNMGRGHHFEMLLESAAQLLDNSLIKFLFIGSGHRRQEVVESAEKLGLTNVLFQPFQPRAELAFSLTVPDLHIVSHRREMFGLQVPSKSYGVLSAGRPLLFVGPERSEIARIINEFDCGIVCSDSSADKITDIIRRLCGDKDRIERLGRNARAALDQRYSKADSMQKWCNALDSLQSGE